MTFNPVLQMVNSVNPAEVRKLTKMGIHASHRGPALRARPPTSEEVDEFFDRQMERILALGEMLNNKHNMAHILPDLHSGIDMHGLDYITRRIDSGEAFGAELKDLRIVKEVADILADNDAMKMAMISGDWEKANRLMSKYAPATKWSRRARLLAEEERGWRGSL